MVDNSANQLATDHERIVSPQTLATLFGTAAEGILRSDGGQRIGSVVVSDAGAQIKLSPTRGRVTHVELTSDTATPVVTHELHFPSRDKQAGDFAADKVIFETHKYDDAGQLIGTERATVDQVDMTGPDMQPFVERIADLRQ